MYREPINECSFCGSPDWDTKHEDGTAAHCSRQECSVAFVNSSRKGREAAWSLAREVHALRLAVRSQEDHRG